jgi:virulence factor Mce-like protein
MPNWAIGVLAVLLIVIGLFLAFSKRIPFTDRGYELTAVVRDAQNLAERSPVRIAGVNVGEVVKVEPVPESNAAEVTMVIKDAGRPVHEDARIQIRPRLFLEGNLFVDVRPGSPSAPELPDGGTIPIQQTSNSVQLDQVLTTLQADVRGNLQLLLEELGNGLTKYGGAEGLRELYRSGAPAYKNTALVNDALLGTKEGDLRGLVKNFDRVFIALNRNQPQLKDLVTNLRTVTGSFAAESDALRTAVGELPGVLDAARPVFDNLNASFPALRAFAREALPGVQSTGPTIDVSLPFIRQLRALVSPSELRGLTADLRPTVPQLAKLARRQIPFNEQARALSSCFTHVVIPWANDKVGNGEEDAAGDPIYQVYKETAYGLVGIAGESRSGDANGQYIRVGAGGGENTVIGGAVPGIGQTFGITPFEILGAEPTISSSHKTPFKPKVPCETQEPPDLRAETGPGPNQTTLPGGGITIFDTPLGDTELGDIVREYAGLYQRFQETQVAEGEVSARRTREDYADLVQEFEEFDQEQMPRYLELLGGEG